MGEKDCGTIISCSETDFQWYENDQFEYEVCGDLFWGCIGTFAFYDCICDMWHYAIMYVQCICNFVLSVSLLCESEKEKVWIHIYIIGD